MDLWQAARGLGAAQAQLDRCLWPVDLAQIERRYKDLPEGLDL